LEKSGDKPYMAAGKFDEGCSRMNKLGRGLGSSCGAETRIEFIIVVLRCFTIRADRWSGVGMSLR